MESPLDVGRGRTELLADAHPCPGSSSFFGFLPLLDEGFLGGLWPPPGIGV